VAQRLARGGGAARTEHRHGRGKSVHARTEGAADDRVRLRRGKLVPAGGGAGQRRPQRAKQGKERALRLGVSMSSKQKRGEGSACVVVERRRPKLSRKRKGEREKSNASRRQMETGTRKSGHRQDARQTTVGKTRPNGQSSSGRSAASALKMRWLLVMKRYAGRRCSIASRGKHSISTCTCIMGFSSPPVLSFFSLQVVSFEITAQLVLWPGWRRAGSNL